MHRKSKTSCYRPPMWQALTPTRIYLDDLRDIWAIVARATEHVSAQTDNRAGFSELTALIDHIQEELPREVIVIGSRDGRPYLRVRLGPNEASVWYRDDLAAYGALALLQRVIWRHARNWGLETVSIPWLTGVLLFILIVPVAMLLAAGPAAYFGAALIAGAGAILGERTRKRRFTILVPEDMPPARWRRFVESLQRTWRSAGWTIFLGLIAQAVWLGLVEVVLPLLARALQGV